LDEPILTVRGCADGSVSGEIETAKRMLQYCKTRESIWTDAQRIQNVELPDLESQLEKLHQEKVRTTCLQTVARQFTPLTQNALEDNSAKLHEESDSNGLLELSAKGLYDKWDLYKREKANLDTLDKKLQDAKSEIAGVTVDKTMETVHDELRVVKEEAEDISAQVRSLFEKQSREEEHLRQLNNRIRSAESRLHEAERTKDAQKLDESRKLAIEANVPVLQTQIEEIQGRLQEYRGQLPSMDSDEAVLATQHGEKEAELDCELSKWRARLAELQTQAETIERYEVELPTPKCFWVFTCQHCCVDTIDGAPRTSCNDSKAWCIRRSKNGKL
jgi:chromosome segregation ATPase